MKEKGRYVEIGRIKKECDICEEKKCYVILDTLSDAKLLVRCGEHKRQLLEKTYSQRIVEKSIGKCMYQNDDCFTCPDKERCCSKIWRN